MSIDTKHGVVYIPTGTPKYEFRGGDRHGDTSFADCILALDARTAKDVGSGGAYVAFAFPAEESKK